MDSHFTQKLMGCCFFRCLQRFLHPKLRCLLGDPLEAFLASHARLVGLQCTLFTLKGLLMRLCIVDGLKAAEWRMSIPKILIPVPPFLTVEWLYFLRTTQAARMVLVLLTLLFGLDFLVKSSILP